MKRLGSLAAVAVFGLTSLTGCGGDDYCGTLEDANADEELADADFTSEEGQQQVLDTLEEISDAAPSELEDDYDVLAEGMQALIDGSPEDVDQAEFQDAFTAINEHAEEECDIDMTP